MNTMAQALSHVLLIGGYTGTCLPLITGALALRLTSYLLLL